MHTAILSQRRTEPHVSNVNTMTEALDIKGQTFWILRHRTKRWHRKKYLNTSNSAVTSTQLISLNYNHFSDITIIFYVE